MGIRRRLLLSFLTLFGVVLVAMAALSTYIIGSAVEHRLQDQTERHARFLSAKPLMVNPIVLGYIKEFTGAESVRDDAPGTVVDGDYVFRARMGPDHELVMTYKADVVSAEKRAAVLPLAGVAALGLLLVLALVLVTAGAFARPLERLAAQARALPSGDVARVGGGA